jgi:hypothetical protein
MDESKRQAVQFLEREIKTYTALALFLSREGIKERVQLGDREVLLGPAYN